MADIDEGVMCIRNHAACDVVEAVVGLLHSGSRALAADALLQAMSLQQTAPHRVDFLCGLLQGVIKSHPDDGEWFVDTMLSHGMVPLDFHSATTLLQACAHAGSAALGEKWLAIMHQQGFEATPASLNALIYACAKGRGVQRAEHFAELLASRGFTPTRVSIKSLVHALAKVGKVRKAEEWAEKMTSAGVPLDRVTYNILLHACARVGNRKKAEKWLRRMLEDKMVPEAKEFSTMLLACGKTADLAGARQWFNIMVESGCRLDVISYSSMINVAAQSANAVEASYWMEELIAKGHTPNVICYNSLLNACARSGDYAASLCWMKHMLASGIQPTRVSFNTMIHASAMGGTRQDSEFWLIRMIFEGHQPDHVTYTALTPTGASPLLPHWVVIAMSVAAREAGHGAPQRGTHHFSGSLEHRAREICRSPLLHLLEGGSAGGPVAKIGLKKESIGTKNVAAADDDCGGSNHVALEWSRETRAVDSLHTSQRRQRQDLAQASCVASYFAPRSSMVAACDIQNQRHSGVILQSPRALVYSL